MIWRAAVRTPLLFAFLFVMVLIANYTAITYDTFYPEQPLMYFANQSILSWRDLLDIYAHPQMMDIFFIPFFRPSGHFLMYQLITPWLGWHNTQGFIVINMFFLALSGLMMIKIYNKLFPTFKIGGYIAFGIYLMHPALILSRFIILHFEFAYIFFMLLSFYYFIGARTLLALLFYMIAVTFKEAAIMLGPAMICYYFIESWRSGTLFKKQSIETLALLMIATMTLGVYLSLQWPLSSNPFSIKITAQNYVDAVREFAQFLLCIPHHLTAQTSLTSPTLVWRTVSVPLVTSIAMWALCLATLIGSILVFKRSNNSRFKLSLAILYLFSLIFLVLPISYAVGVPWHLSPSLVFLSLGMGFCVEYILRNLIKSEKTVLISGGLIALLLALSTVLVNNANIAWLESQQSGFIFKVLRNAVNHPPAIKSQLNPNSLIVIEDGIIKDGYYFGSISPNLLPGVVDYEKLEKEQMTNFLKFKSIYTGTLFKWAYLIPTLSEQIYQFRADDFSGVPDEFIYYWLQHFDNIFCLGYDKDAVWHDRTAVFKQTLLKEQARRHIRVNHYEELPATQVGGALLYVKSLPFPDAPVCQFMCDQDQRCNGFNYIESEMAHHPLIQCQFYREVVAEDQKFCLTCTGYKKTP